ASTPLRSAFAASAATVSRCSAASGRRRAPQRRTGTPSASSAGARRGPERSISSVSSSPAGESKPVCRMPELVPLAASPGSGSASSTTTATLRRVSASATAQPTTPAPTTATSASTPHAPQDGWLTGGRLTPYGRAGHRCINQTISGLGGLGGGGADVADTRPAADREAHEDLRRLEELGYRQEL